MKFFVNGNCIGCGMCEGTCPAVFHMTDEGVAMAIDTEVDPTVEGLAQEAMAGCPVGAIEEA